MGDDGENNPKRGNSQLLVVPGFFFFSDSRVNSASPNRPSFFKGGQGGGYQAKALVVSMLLLQTTNDAFRDTP